MSDRTLYELTFGEGYTGPAEVAVSLPSGAKKLFNRFQSKPSAADYPSIVAAMTEGEAMQYRSHGFAATPVEAVKPADLDKLTKPQLAVMALGRGFDVTVLKTKAELVAALKTAQEE